MHPQLISNSVEQDGLELVLSLARVSGLSQAGFEKGKRGEREVPSNLPGP